MNAVTKIMEEIQRERDEELVTLTRRELKQIFFMRYIAEGMKIKQAEIHAEVMVGECAALRRGSNRKRGCTVEPSDGPLQDAG